MLVGYLQQLNCPRSVSHTAGTEGPARREGPGDHSSLLAAAHERRGGPQEDLLLRVPPHQVAGSHQRASDEDVGCRALLIG